MTTLQHLQLSSLARWVGCNLSSKQALQRAVECEELEDYGTAEKLLQYAELKEMEELAGLGVK